MRMTLFRLFLPAAIALALAACTSTPPAPPDAKIDSQSGALFVPAAEVALVDNYKPTLKPPHIEHDFQKRPVHIVERWVEARVAKTSGADGKLTITIKDASVVLEEALPTEQGFKGLLKREPERQMTGRLVWELAYESADLTWRGEAEAKSVRTVPEQASLNQVDGAYADLLETLAKNFDLRTEEQIKNLRSEIAKWK